MNYTHLRLQDQGEVLIVYFQEGTLTDQNVIEQIGKEFTDVALKRPAIASCS